MIQTDNLTIEHILPQNKNLSTAWQKMLGDDWINVQNKYLHTLGNLTLTGYNSELGDKPFEEKKEKLQEVHTKIVRLYRTVKDCMAWNKESIENRANVLADEVCRIFPIEMPEKMVSFTDPRYNEYRCDEPDEATNKTPNYYVLQGERVNIDSYADMLRSVMRHLYQMNPGIIERMAQTNERPLSWSQAVLFSYDKNIIGRDTTIKDTDIYIASGFSAAYIICLIRAMLEKYDIELSDFAFSARSYKQNN